jgi:hypothetical protein
MAKPASGRRGPWLLTADLWLRGDLAPRYRDGMQQLTIDELHTLRLSIFDNAESLHKEAKVLFDAGFHARAYLLAYFACEELGKLPIIVGIAGNLNKEGSGRLEKSSEALAGPQVESRFRRLPSIRFWKRSRPFERL